MQTPNERCVIIRRHIQCFAKDYEGHMDDLKGVFLGCLLGIVGLTQAQSAIAANDAAVLQSMRELSSRIYATTRDIGNAHAQSILPTPLDARIRALKRTIDAILKQAIVADEPARTAITRKAQSLSRLIENLERLDAHPSQKAIASLVPQHSATAHLLTFAGITDQRGGNCAHPSGSARSRS
jgi:hypothetical protein